MTTRLEVLVLASQRINSLLVRPDLQTRKVIRIVQRFNTRVKRAMEEAT